MNQVDGNVVFVDNLIDVLYIPLSHLSEWAHTYTRFSIPPLILYRLESGKENK